jgi:dGTPase
LKRFLHRKVYASPALVEDRRRSMGRIGDLFGFFMEHPDRLPQPYAELAAAEPAHRVVCDYIAGMTDLYFDRIYGQIIGPALTPRWA